MLSIAMQLHSIREDFEKDFKKCLTAVKEMGYEGVEFAGLYGNSAETVTEMLDELGLIPVSAHVSYQSMIADPNGILGIYAKMGCKYIAVPSLPEESRVGAEKGEEAISGIRILGETAKKLGMTLLYHNHDFEFEKLNGEYKLDLLYKAVPADLLQTELDTCWVSVAGEDPAKYVRKYAGRAPLVHLKDYFQASGSVVEFRPLGSGQQDIPSILAAAKSSGSSWVIVEQDKPTPSMSAMECAKISINYLKSIL